MCLKPVSLSQLFNDHRPCWLMAVIASRFGFEHIFRYKVIKQVTNVSKTGYNSAEVHFAM